MAIRDKFDGEITNGVKIPQKDHFERFMRFVSQRMLKQHNPETFKHLVQLLTEFWMLNDIFPDVDIGDAQVKLCDLDEENKCVDAVPAEENVICGSIDIAQIEKDFQVVEMKPVLKSETGVIACSVRTKEPITANIADEVTKVKHVNGEQASRCMRCLVSLLIQCWLSLSTAAMTRIAVFFCCSTILMPHAAMASSVSKIWQTPDNISQVLFCHEMEDKMLLDIHTQNSSGFSANLEIDASLNISKDVEVSSIAHGLQKSIFEIVNPAYQESQSKSILLYSDSANEVLNVTNRKCKAGAKEDNNRSSMIDNVGCCHTTVDGFGRNDCTKVEQEIENRTMSERSNDKASSHDDITLQLVMNATIPRSMPDADIGHNYCEAVLNADYSTGQENKCVIGNIKENMTSNRTSKVCETNTLTKTSNFLTMEFSSIQDGFPMNSGGFDWSDLNQLLVILLLTLLVRVYKAQVLESKKKRERGHQNMKAICSQAGSHVTRNLRRFSSSSNKSIEKNNGWLKIVLLIGICCCDAIAASTTSTPDPIIQTVNATVDESLSLSCDEAVGLNFKWRIFKSTGYRKTLYDSSKDKNNTNTSMTFLSNGTLIFHSIRKSDMAEYVCIVYVSKRDAKEFIYHLDVQNSTFNFSAVQVEVTTESIPVSESNAGKITAGVFVVLVLAAISGVTCYFVKKRRIARRQRQCTRSRPDQKNSLKVSMKSIWWYPRKGMNDQKETVPRCVASNGERPGLCLGCTSKRYKEAMLRGCEHKDQRPSHALTGTRREYMKQSTMTNGHQPVNGDAKVEYGVADTSEPNVTTTLMENGHGSN